MNVRNTKFRYALKLDFIDRLDNRLENDTQEASEPFNSHMLIKAITNLKQTKADLREQAPSA